MNYNEALNFMIKKQSLGVKPGLKRIINALKLFSNPQDFYKTIHIAGTNGKGTVAATIAKALTNEGYKVGLFTSPWVTDYREQIQINGKMISEKDFCDYVEMCSEINSGCTEFETLYLIACNYFKDNKVDFAVIECGMGGREDATNVEKSNLSVITSISLDHTDFLGNTISKIAEEKSGILRKDCTCILYDEELKVHFEGKCKKLVTEGINDNLSLVNAALNELGVLPCNELVRLPARQERIRGILLDGGHNVAAAKMLEPVIFNEVALIGMMKDKDVEGYLSVVAPKCKKIIATTTNNIRSMSAEELSLIAKKFCENIEIIEDAKEAVKNEEITLICGSFYLIREIRNLLI